ncbi:protoheme IX farnesyltransferase, mitochondrial isoform X2 [Amaranthus tricolor]|uniref:protoheme IX farnesyltransferase, mitochondrial isoform X2 n=1 Tax=Amaranthus tricolor TaxID=29722 RepID=UPI00258F8290|nr:protoheme IX farnesyltransferase, mitochondrial isoform X2 [Amaranthus tricolor]
MWRTSLSFSSKRFNHLSTLNPNSVTSFHKYLPFFDIHGRTTSLSHLYSSTIPKSSDSSKLGFGFNRLSQLGFAVDASSSLSRDLAGAISHYGRCYWDLSKAKLSMLVVATSGTGYVLGSGQIIDLAGLCWTCAGTMMVAASANSLNQVFEVTNDAKMKRTMNRPLPSGRISSLHAVTWASTVGIAGTTLLACKANALAAGLGASNLLLYAFIYTPMKQLHPVNTWVGAVVGAIPPLLGWAAASGGISLNGMILPAALYFWQIPHFMALAYLCRDDYAAGGYKMFSLTDASGRKTALVALRNCLYLIPVGYLAYEWGLTSGWFCLESSLLTLAIGGTALSFYFNRTTKNARRMFLASLLYLPVFMSGLMFHRLYDNWQSYLEDDSATLNIPSLEVMQENDSADSEKKEKNRSAAKQVRPPVAFASVAPFPFLPAPSYSHY